MQVLVEAQFALQRTPPEEEMGTALFRASVEDAGDSILISAQNTRSLVCVKSRRSRAVAGPTGMGGPLLLRPWRRRNGGLVLPCAGLFLSPYPSSLACRQEPCW